VSQSGIEWTDWTLNPVKGKCPVACPYCYAGEMYDRFGWNPEIRFCPSVFNTLPEKPVRVFVGSTMELFLFDDWMERILNRCQDFPQHTFLFLTKKPERLPQWSPFPDNCQVGVTATNRQMYNDAIYYLKRVIAKVKYISLEPLLERINPAVLPMLPLLNWPIIGALTGRKSKIMELARKYPELTPMPWGRKWTLQPKIEWVEEVVRAADQAGIPVFLKNNLNPLFAENYCAGFKKHKNSLFKIIDDFPTRYHLRQEMPG